jgi:hypothetical protein
MPDATTRTKPWLKEDTKSATKSDPVSVTFDAESWPHVLAALHTRLGYVAERAARAEEPLLAQVWAARRKEVARALMEMESAVRSRSTQEAKRLLGSASV